ncbi:uncharacterized protein A4U43_C07F23260 [Asparagus officinalis]|uniref:Uncharacterized protein n=1 Tax=Asparagus officinalis TaxID=4686 RepID=A0A5P1EE87_ASPOF|nr:uncharacterized protein LOC109850470 [Asparagus officinalis]ONK64208.1 uncharacterized protein A4U43_C07F23260 [Asparagus officinalis]
MAVVLSKSPISASDLHLRSVSGCSLKPLRRHSLVSMGSRNLSMIVPVRGRRLEGSKNWKRGFSVRASVSDGGSPNSSNIFIGGFVLGGIIVGALGCIYAPQISRALAGTDKKELMRKLPKFIYDEEKALERTRKILTEKIAQLNSAIDGVSSQLRADDEANGAAVASDEVEAAV